MSLTLLGVSNDVAGAPATFYILLEDGFIILCENSDKLRQE
jgi:hypothetical protein